VPALVLSLVTMFVPIFLPALIGIVLAVLGLVRAAQLRRDGHPPVGGTLSARALGAGIFFVVYNLAIVWIVFNVLPRLVWIIFGGSWDSPPSG
jgi:hypothetical protein